MTAEEDRAFEQDQIMSWARKLWPRTSQLRPIKTFSSICNGQQWYMVLSDSGNKLAMAFLDPTNFLPWFQPVGSTEPDECGG